MRVFSAVIVAVLMCPIWAQAQDKQTLADMRQDLEFVYGEIVKLKRELSTTGNSSQKSSNGPALQRIDALEAEVRRITGSLEQKQFWINSIVKDGTNRVGDLEFRLCELENGCDVTKLDRTQPLGGRMPDQAAVASPAPASNDSGVTNSEQATFQRAMAAYEAKDYANAAKQFDGLIGNFPGGPLTGEAHYWKGSSLARSGDWGGAANSFLESFSGAPEGTKAPEALYKLGVSLKQLGQIEEACLMLAEVPIRYPASAIIPKAKADHAALGCQ